MTSLADIETPAVLIDIDRVEANLKRAQDYADSHGLPLRPHIKTHKLPRFAKRQVELGAVGITCQKLSEAEAMADAGLADIFLPYNILGAEKLDRLKALAARVTLSVTADSLETVRGLSQTFATAPSPLKVLVECDTGMHRCGVASVDALVSLARAIAEAPGLQFGGMMTYPAKGTVDATAAWLAEGVAALSAAGLPPEIVSNGGTPDMWRAHTVTAATEHRPGTYIYLDRFQVNEGVGRPDDCALTVLASVVSHPESGRAVIDAGSKSLTSDTLGLEGHGWVRRLDGTPVAGAELVGLSEEHGVMRLEGPDDVAIGEKVRIVPNHACVVSNLFDYVHIISGESVIATERVAARGGVT